MKTLFSIMFLINSVFAHDLVIYDIALEKFLSKEKFLENQENNDSFIFGEIHYHKCVQKAEAEVIDWISQDRKTEITVAMEFIDYNKQSETEYWAEEYQSGSIGLREFTEKLIGNRNQDLIYAPILRNTILNGGQILGTNSPRDIKSILMTEGYEKIPGEFKVSNFIDGSINYYDRFKIAMEGHATQEQIKKYFQAQVYTDNYIAEKLIEKKKFPISIQIIGSFHTDYLDGLIKQINARQNEQLTTIKFVDQKDIRDFIKPHSKYGKVANYLIGCQ